LEEGSVGTASLAIACLLTAACGSPSRSPSNTWAPERADLEVELVPPIAWRFVVHGNCFAGWYMSVDLVVHERSGANVLLDLVSLHVEDDRTGELLGERTFDPTAAPERFGASGPVVRGHNSLRINMSVGALKGSVDAPAISGFIVVSGDVQGYDEQGRVRTSYRLTAVVTVDDRPVPSSGACTPRS
jgi:hypothetical protein